MIMIYHYLLHLPIYPSTYSFICPPIHPSIYPYIHIYINPSIHPSTHPFIHQLSPSSLSSLSITVPFKFTPLSIHPLTHPSIHLHCTTYPSIPSLNPCRQLSAQTATYY